jgi:hypothetical protein
MHNHRRIGLILLAILFLPLVVKANQNGQGWCENEAHLAVRSRIGFTMQVQTSYPQSRVAVYVHGGLARLYADNANTLLANPFKANSNDQWLFYVAEGRYDIQFPGVRCSIPVTYLDLSLNDADAKSSFYRVLQSNSVTLPQQSILKVLSPFACLNNVAKSCSDSIGSHRVTSPFISTNPMLWNVEMNSKGSGPFYDITRYGARSIPPGHPGPLVTSCSTTAGSGTMTLRVNTGNQILNGDSVRCDGAGPPTALARPTGLTAAPYVNTGGSTSAQFKGPSTGGTAYSYKIIACDKQGGCTAATAAASTTMGPTTLGRITARTSSMTLSNQTLTVNTASAHGLSPHEMVYIQYFSSNTSLFEGFYIVATTPSSTQFTVTTSYDSRVAGTPTLDTSSATVVGFNCVHLQWAPVTNAWKYYIYGRSGGSYNLIGVSLPEYPAWDDYGSPMMDNFTFPENIPTTAPSSATNDYLIATVTAGGGTTTLTVTPTASNTVSGAYARMGSDGAIIAAINAIQAGNEGGNLYIPAGDFYTTGYLAFPTLYGTNFFRVEQFGRFHPGDTVELHASWHGAAASNVAAFGWDSYPIISAGGAFPIFYYPNFSGVQFDHVNIQNYVANGGLIFLTDSGASSNFSLENVSLAADNGGVQDYMGQLAVFRGGFSFRFTHSTFLGGQAPNVTETQIGYSFLPAFVMRASTDGNDTAGGNLKFEQDWFVGRAGVEQNNYPGLPGESVPGGEAFNIFKDIQTQNLPIPFFSITAPGYAPGGNIIFDGVSPADFPTPIYAGFAPGCTYGIYANLILPVQGSRNLFTGCNAGITSINTSLTGINREAVVNIPYGTYVLHPTYGSYTGSQLSVRQNLDMSAGHGITFPMSSTAPKVAISGSGTIPAGTYVYAVAVVGADGAMSAPGAPSASITVNGGQAVSVSWIDVPGATKYIVYKGPGGAYYSSVGGPCGNLSGVQANNCTDNGSAGGYSSASFNGTGYPSLYPGQISTQKLSFGSSTGGNYGSATLSGNFTAKRTITIPDATFTMAQLIATGTSTLGTSVIKATTCAFVVTAPAPGVTTADAIYYSFKAAPPGAYAAGLLIQSYVTPGNVNFLVCNPTANSLLPPAATLNWRVIR